MNFPVWELHWAGGGLLIAAMAVFYVYIAHFAVGGGLFLVLTERMGYRRNSPGILKYTRQRRRPTAVRASRTSSCAADSARSSSTSRAAERPASLWRRPMR